MFASPSAIASLNVSLNRVDTCPLAMLYFLMAATGPLLDTTRSPFESNAMPKGNAIREEAPTASTYAWPVPTTSVTTAPLDSVSARNALLLVSQMYSVVPSVTSPPPI